MLNIILIVIAFACGGILLSKGFRDNRAWRATVTPLASIIGSGFLVIVPLLGKAVGGYAPLAMLGVVALAYAVGAAIRFNIMYVEPVLAKPGTPVLMIRLETVSDIALGLAYFISVTFYIRLLASFAMHEFEVEGELMAQLLTTAILAFIGIAGWVRGLSFLERLEEYSVSIKLAIIVSLIVGWTVHDIADWRAFELAPLLPAQLDGWHVTRLMAGVLIVVQGFETSRYLGDEYERALRVSTMRRAQIISGLIYIIFVTLTVPTFNLLSDEVNDTAIMDLSRTVASVLPLMLVVAAIMSQLSAAVADTVGAGGLFSQTVGKRFKLPAKAGYLVVASAGIALVWIADIFDIITLASRAFALYYGLQSLEAAIAASQLGLGRARWMRVGGFGILALLLLMVAVIAIPAG